MSAVPELLQSGVIGGVEVVTLEDRVQLAVLAMVVGNGGAGANDWLAACQQFSGAQRPEERHKAVDVTDLLHRVAETRNLLAAEQYR